HIGRGLGGPARTQAEAYRWRVIGIDLTRSFLSAATAMNMRVGIDMRTAFTLEDTTIWYCEKPSFETVMTIHDAMNIAGKDKMYLEARRVLKPGGVFAVYDVLQGEGGGVLYPVPWARDPSISHVARPDEMKSLLTNAGFKLLDVQDSTEESQ